MVIEMAKDFLKVTTYAAVFGIIGGMSFQGYNMVADKLMGQEQQSAYEERQSEDSEEIESTNDVVKTSVITATGAGVSAVAEKVLPSIVAVNMTMEVPQQSWFGTYSEDVEGSGSGIIIREDEESILIATNNHVVEDAKSVTVRFVDDETADAEVKGTEASSDLAVVQIKKSDLKESTLKAIQPITLGSSDETKVGEQAIALGNALGYGNSVTVGIISAKDREVSMDDFSMKLLQTDAAINPGNSGGALVNSRGELIGINSAKYASEEVEGMGFAIPIDTALPIIEDIMDRKLVSEDEQAYLGIRGKDFGSDLAKYYNMEEGIYVGEVSEDSPAEKAGIYVGDIIVGFNGKDVKTMEELQNVLAYTKAGTTVDIVLHRMEKGRYEKKTISVTLGKKVGEEQTPQETIPPTQGWGW